MTEDRPARHPWEAELEAEVLAEEYARRGESYSTGSQEQQVQDTPGAAESPDRVPAETGAGGGELDAEAQDELARRFEIEFMQQTSREGTSKGWLEQFLATNEGRVILIAVIACILLVLIGRLLSGSVSSRISPPAAAPEAQTAGEP